MKNDTERLPIGAAKVPQLDEINKKDILTREEVAVYLDVPLACVRELLKRDKSFPQRKIGKYLRFSKKTVESWITSGDEVKFDLADG